jgi:hypothetical protein
MNWRARTPQLITQSPLEAEREVWLHRRAQGATACQRRQHAFHAAIKVSAVNVKDAHKFSVRLIV